MVNWLARAWHDYTHFTIDRGYNSIDEIVVGKVQASELPHDWWYEKALIDADITGQILYHNKYNKFPKDQRKFVLEYLKTGKI